MHPIFHAYKQYITISQKFYVFYGFNTSITVPLKKGTILALSKMTTNCHHMGYDRVFIQKDSAYWTVDTKLHVFCVGHCVLHVGC